MHMPPLPRSRSHIMIHFMNHDYIGSLWQYQMSQQVEDLMPCFLNGYDSFIHIDAMSLTCLPGLYEFMQE